MSVGYDKKNTSKIYVAVLSAGAKTIEPLACIAREIGCGIAKKNAVTVCGGVGGVFKNAFIGARQLGGVTIALTPDTIQPEACICDYVIPTGMGTSRHSIIANMCNGAIILGGWIGSLSLAVNFLLQNKPVVALRGTGGVADSFLDRVFIDESHYKFHVADTTEAAISLIFDLVEQNMKAQ